MRSKHLGAIVLAVTLPLSSGSVHAQAPSKADHSATAVPGYDAAVEKYERACKANPQNVPCQLRLDRARFEAAQAHVEQGRKLREAGATDLAIAEFERAMRLDPASPAARQELQSLQNAMHPSPPAGQQPTPPAATADLLEQPPALTPLSRQPLTLKLTSDAKTAYISVAKLAGINVIFDPDFNSRPISTELVNITYEQALDLIAAQSKSFWKPVAANVIEVFPDQPQKRKDQEEQIMRTFYLSNNQNPQDLADLVNGLKQLLELKRVWLANGQSAIVIRDTPDKLLLAEKLIHDVDKARPEVVVQVSVLQARRDRARNLGVLPSTSVAIGPTVRPGLGVTPGSVTLNNLTHLSSSDYSVTLPAAVATALLADSTTKVIQNPEIRVADGQSAKLRVGDRVPVATGSFQAGVVTGNGNGLSPLVNTQFQYLDVGVNIDITPHVHPDHEVSLRVGVEISAVTSRVNIGGIDQPVISQRKIEHDIRLREGEISVLGGLVERAQGKSVSGLPGLAKLPLLRYLFSGETTENSESEVLIVLTPRVVRATEITAENVRSLSVGTDANLQVRRKEAPVAAVSAKEGGKPADRVTQSIVLDAQEVPPVKVKLQPSSVLVPVDGSESINVLAENVHDLFSVTLVLKYDPAVLSLEARQGGFLSGGTQEVAIVQRVDKEKGQADILITRQPNTAGINGTGPVLKLLLRRIAPGDTTLQLVQAAARDSRQRPFDLVQTDTTVSVH